MNQGPGNEPTRPTVEGVLAAAAERRGFLTPAEVEYLAEHDRLRQVLVRCGACRFVCAAQDVLHLVEMVEGSSLDYVRDVSLPTREVSLGEERR